MRFFNFQFGGGYLLRFVSRGGLNVNLPAFVKTCVCVHDSFSNDGRRDGRPVELGGLQAKLGAGFLIPFAQYAQVVAFDGKSPIAGFLVVVVEVDLD